MEDEIPTSAKDAKRVAIISSILIILLITTGVIWYSIHPFINPDIENSNPPSTTVTPITTPAIVSQSPSVVSPIQSSSEIYTSQNLSIRFRFLPKQSTGNEIIKIAEEGNKVYVYPSSVSISQGQFIEQFNKSEKDSLDVAIRTQILSGKDPNRCLITIQKKDNRIRAEITFPSSTDDSMDAFFANSEYCSKEYAQTNGLRYFMYDETQPKKFYFISVGQYPITADNNTPWQDTIEIIN